MEPSAFLKFVRFVITGDVTEVTRHLLSSPELAITSLPNASNANSSELFFTEIHHYIYGGDTALHMAAAAVSLPVTQLLFTHGANCRARNRRGAEPLHYAADGGGPNSQSRAEVIKCLVSNGAAPRSRQIQSSSTTPGGASTSYAAVLALLDAGANLRQPNDAGSTPLHLAVQTTGAS